VLFLLLSLISLCSAEDRWATGPTEGVRWPDVKTVSVNLAEGDEVEVMTTKGDLVRVRKGTDFGWVPASSLTNVAPPPKPAAIPDAPTEGLPEAPDDATTPDGGDETPAPAPAPGSAPSAPANGKAGDAGTSPG
jgi:hypothetical protein